MTSSLLEQGQKLLLSDGNFQLCEAPAVGKSLQAWQPAFEGDAPGGWKPLGAVLNLRKPKQGREREVFTRKKKAGLAVVM